MSDAGSTAGTEDFHAIAHVEFLTGIDLLDDGNGAGAAIEFHGDIDALPGVHRLFGMGADRAADQRATNGTGGIGGMAFADVVAEESAGDTAEQSAGLIAAFDFHRADGGDAAGLDALHLAGVAAAVGVTGEGVLGAGGEQKRHGQAEKISGFHRRRA